jgi:hypothetical protein
MNWQEISNNPAFNDLPFKFEINKWGKLKCVLQTMDAELLGNSQDDFSRETTQQPKSQISRTTFALILLKFTIR